MNKLDDELLEQLVSKFNQLFITKRGKYLILNKKGNYLQINKSSSKFVALNDFHVKNHLKGIQTLGVFSGDFLTKFICFDVDYHDNSLAKWYTYKVVDTLINIGIPSEFIYISTSGNKGYHVDIYFNEMISLQLQKRLFDLVIESGELQKTEQGQIELRPTQQGLKLPLGVHFGNKNTKTNKCWYVDYNKKLEPIKSYTYLLEINQIDISIIKNVLGEIEDLTLESIPVKTDKGMEIESNKDYFDINHNELDIYKINIDPDATVEAAIKLEENGLTYKGTRHKSIMLLSRYYRYLGHTQEESEALLIDWMKNQDKETYTTPIEECIKDIKRVNNYIFDNDIGLTVADKEIIITYPDVLNILKAKNMNDKLIAYALLVHSKRYESKNGVFYMSYKQMAKTTGLSERTANRTINKLEELGIIEIIERNIKSGNSKNNFKKPNKYRMNKIEAEIRYELTLEDEYINDATKFHLLLDASVMILFTVEELKDLLPKNQYLSYRKAIQSATHMY
ncbi:TOTE conflict system archaeo-eukaryotic primase domain-containing protein [Cytobacillus gottheilii]|uniref:TOTE conflict system archaeo-eukaryotic primase domain-containing protein n=1 Tax=Cytobacillus gottheilii TaxID=859144 RepID=UPI0009B99B38|nr:helix-turn-helix domain-containing protein [Cytobacillus gottheilii]